MTDAQIVSEQKKKPSLYKTLFATCIGNALEWFDIAIYAFFASYIARAFFPVKDETLSLIITFASFGISFLIRPIGAIVLGAYADKHGRKASLLASIALMMVGSLMIATMPTFATIGIAAPILILVARLIQGFSAGGEFGSSTAFLVEHFPERKAFIASWQFATQGVSTLMAALFGLILAKTLTEAQIYDWGWRIPFIFGLLIGPVGLYIRRHIDESPTFKAAEKSQQPLKEIVTRQKSLFFIAVGLMVISTAINYMLNYVPTYATKTLGVASSTAYTATVVAGVILTVVTPMVGLLAEKVGRLPLMVGSLVLLLVTVYPGFSLTISYLSPTSLILLIGWLALLKSVYFATVPSMMADIFPVKTRATGMALSYNVAVTVFGGFAPMICTSLISLTGSSLAPSYYLIVVGFMSLFALYKANQLNR
ncbi:MFS transporter [Zophobihabitans entericus]|uniref:MFS transporter n=1 Tax=Zophobihabitans entericus TaxID=1635327 RepID=A0A6G9IAY2_9GAMM|nr:MFS transporter [Zophobihabitans entericus]QIQ21386.1 MFS transporter [Zophobihabitans entericus]